jgi:ABC-type glycerol-3-phosphate transport system substrate-binding protein
VRRLARWTIAALAVALGLGGAACGRPRVQEVVFWEFWPVADLQPLIDEFERSHPGLDVRVERLTWREGRERIGAAIASGDVPDLCEIGSTWMPEYLASGRLADWSAGTADLRAGLRGWPLVTLGDAVYGLPWMLGTRVLFYNKALFARAGLDSSRAPETWEELRAAAAAIDALGGGVRGCGVQAAERNILFKKFMPFAWGNGGRILSDDLSAAEFDSPENREALDYYLSLRDLGRLGTQDSLDRAFAAGRLGVIVSGAWLLNALPRDAPGLRFGVALVPRPAVERGTHASFAGGELLVSFQASKHKHAALQLARFLVAPAQASALALRIRSVQPALVAAETTAAYRGRPHEQVLLRQIETAYFTPNHPRWSEMEEAIEDAIGRALGDPSPARAEVAARAVSEAQQRLAALVRR